MPKIHETAIELHRELARRGLELNPQVGRDAALHAALAAKLKLPADGFSPALAASGKSAEEYLRCLVEIAQPFAQMFQKIWSYLSGHCAPKADESLLVRFGLDHDNQTEIDWNQLRLMVESSKKIWAAGPVMLWPRKQLFNLGSILHPHAGPWPNYTDHYERGKPFQLPEVAVSNAEDEIGRRVREVLQSWIDAVHASWPIERERKRDLPELVQSSSKEGSESDDRQTLLDLSFMLTDLVPIWRHILDSWSSIPEAAKKEASRFFDQEIAPRLVLSSGGGWRSLLEALDILDLPFWKHRWHTYEVWAAIVALEALHEYHPQLVVTGGHVALDAASPALIARLGAQQTVYAHAQGETKLPVPFGKRKAIKPDLRFSIDDPTTIGGTVAIVEFKQRRELDVAHVSEVLGAYSLGVGLGGGVVLINYDAIPTIAVPPLCVLLGDVHPGAPNKVRAYQEAVRGCFSRAGIIPPLTKLFVLLDVSGSMGSEYTSDAAQRGLRRLVALPWVKVFRFNDGLEAGGDLETNHPIRTGGGTQLGAALQQLFALAGAGIPERLLIVTDGGHDHPTALLSMCGACRECMAEDLENQLGWLTKHDS